MTTKIVTYYWSKCDICRKLRHCRLLMGEILLCTSCKLKGDRDSPLQPVKGPQIPRSRVIFAYWSWKLCDMCSDRRHVLAYVIVEHQREGAIADYETYIVGACAKCLNKFNEEFKQLREGLWQ